MTGFPMAPQSGEPPHDYYDELAVGHALAALEPAEEQAFVAHLDGCRRCQQQLAEHAETLAQLAFLPAPAEPSPALFAAIRSQIEPADPQPLPAQRGDDLERARERRVAALGHRRARMWSTAAAGLLVVGSLAVWNTDLLRDSRRQDAAADQVATALRLIEEAPGRTVPLTAGEEKAIQAVAVLHGERLSLVANGLPVNDADETSYVLWSLSGSGNRAVGSFDVTQPGPTVVRRDLPLGAPAGQVTGFAISREPQATEEPQQPTLPLVATGDLT